MNRVKRKRDPDHPLYKAFLSLKTPEECYAFLTDLCTDAELNAMEQRLDVAAMLDDGMIYNDILERTGASSTTVSRVGRALRSGTDGYAVVLERLKEGEKV